MLEPHAYGVVELAIAVRRVRYLAVDFGLGRSAGQMGTFLAVPICALAFGDASADSAGTFVVWVWMLPTHLPSSHTRVALIAGGQQPAPLSRY